MSKARLVITAITVEKRPVSEVARSYGVARSWVYTLLARYEAEGEAAFEPRSRRPKNSPSVTAPGTVELIIRLRKELAGQGLDAGPQTIAWHLEQNHRVKVPPATVSRYLARQGLVTPDPSKRPKPSYIRFAAEQPNECRQSDFTRYPLAGGTDTEILTRLDDHSRYALSVTAHDRVTGPAVLLAFRAACDQHGVPASTLTDNGMVFTTRLSGGRGGRNGPEHELRRLGVKQKNGKPNHPQTQGKVERFQQTMKNWLRAQPHQPQTLSDLQTLLDVFAVTYNTRRPHRSLPGRVTPPPPTPQGPRPSPATAPPTPTTGSAPTASTTPDSSPSATRDASTTSASAAPTPEPASCSSSRTCTSASSTQTPASSSANSPSTRTSATRPPEKHQAGQRKTPRTLRRFAVSSMTCDITVVAGVGFEPS
jgi:transposase InsO family protein